MVFTPPSWVPQLPFSPPDSITIAQFLQNEKYGRQPYQTSRNPFTCGFSGKILSPFELWPRVDHLARAFAKHLKWEPNEGTPWDKVLCIFSLNAVDYITVAHAVHRLSGIVTPANAVSSASELENQLRLSGAKAIVTCQSLLEITLQAAKTLNIPHQNIFILEVFGQESPASFAAVKDLISEGSQLPSLEPLRWSKGQGQRQTAFLCYSSGTSGLPKGVMISHYNVIANVMQITAHESVGRRQFHVCTQVQLGLLPLSHIYGLVFIAHTAIYRGDEVIVMPKFDLRSLLEATQRFKIEQLMLVPPIILQLIRNREEIRKYDLSSVRCVYSAAAPLAEETIGELLNMFPGWHVGQGYGLTETSPAVSGTGENDMLFGSAGSLLPGSVAKIIDGNGKEVKEYEKPGELLVQSPAVTLGYLNNESATMETFVHDDEGRWIRTGDEVCVRKAPSGFEHLVILDRIKELIKVKGHQVAPAELEAHLLTHSAVEDCAVVGVLDSNAGELPKAFIVKSSSAQAMNEDRVKNELHNHVEKHKAHYKWLRGGIEFINIIPKSPSGKILRRVLRDRESERMRRMRPKI